MSALPLLGGLSAEEFLADYWQKRPLLIRQAIPGFMGLMDADELAGLACEDSALSRLVIEKTGPEGSHWQLRQGPFGARDFRKLPDSHWSLLVQEVNHFLPEAWDLLLRFGFIPFARLEDLMVSYAAPQGSVGAHFDSYDVFLLQGQGRREWRISAQTDLALVEDAPLKLLKNFQAEQSWVLEPGDMLYLPPRIAHHGIAQDACMTYSIGFRAPSRAELLGGFLDYLHEQLQPEGLYSDPDLPLQAHPAELSSFTLDKSRAMLDALRWDEAMFEDFLGRFLTEPRPHVVFDPPEIALGLAAFSKILKQAGSIELALPSRLLYRGQGFFMNGEATEISPADAASFSSLANQRRLELPARLNRESIGILHAWHRAGFIVLSD
ncbi:cupin domain-containing protein [Thermithiobacillus plumbiphilus]|uniref:Cupin domain-containing protein n=1 Tax=Thermithiobacillus plumbiphilus TaxID=1729899 RepID=A0ABU9DA81_9PROT